jgi:hypothetical protein
MYWTRLFIAVKKLHPKMALETFNICIKDLLLSKFINRNHVIEKGKKVDYFLTHKGKQYVRFILDHENRDNGKRAEEKERLVMLLLLLFLFRRPHDYVYRSEQEFKDLLLRNNLSEKDLLRRVPSVKNENGRTIITTTFESDSGIYVWKIDILDKRKYPVVRSCVYKYDVPGLSKRDVLESHNKPAFWHINFTEEEVQDMFESLRDEKDPILRAIAFDHDGEPRYDISDPSLRKLLDTYWKIYNAAYFVIQTIWKCVRRPTEDERSWLELLNGTQTADKICRTFYEKRKRFKNSPLFIKETKEEMKDCNNKINNLVLSLKKRYSNVIEKYQFPCDELLEIIHPKFFQELGTKID